MKDRYSGAAVLRSAWRRRWQVAVPAMVIALAASWWIHRLPNRYQSHALLLVVPQRVPEAFVRSTVAMRSSERLQAITQQILSRTELERIIAEFDLYADARQTASMQDVVDAMRTRDIEIKPVKGDAFRLGYVGDRPEVAMKVVERLVSLFIDRTSVDRAALAEGTDHFLETQLEDARRRLIENETKLTDYRRAHNGELPTQLEANVRGLHNTEMQLQVLADSLNRDRDRHLMLERSLKDASLSALIDGSARTGADATTLSAAEQLARAEATLRDMRATLTSQHPDVVAQNETIAGLRKLADAEAAGRTETSGVGMADQIRQTRVEDLRTELAQVERQIAQKTAEVERLRSSLLGYQRRIEGAPAREAELTALTRDYDTLQQNYRGLLTKKQESAIAANLERQQVGAHFKVIDPPRLPETPFSPNRPRLYGLASLIGLLVGIISAVTVERLTPRLRTEEDVAAALGRPVLATIPLVSSSGRRLFRPATAITIGTVLAAGAAMVAWRLWI